MIKDHLVGVSVLDQSSRTPTQEATVIDDRFSWLIPMFCSRGKDNTIIEFNSGGKLTKMFGDDLDNIKLYGHAGLIAKAALRNGAKVFGCRLLASDAKRSNLLVSVAVKNRTDIPVWERTSDGDYTLDASGEKIPVMDDLVQEVTTGKEVKIVTETITTYGSEGVPAPAETVSSDGTWTTYPLFYIYYFGRGKCGNDFGISVSSDFIRDKMVTDGRRYIFSSFERTLSGSVRSLLSESLYFAFDADAMYSDTSDITEYLGSIYPSDLEPGVENPIKLVDFPENYNTLITDLATVEGISVNDVDPLFCKNKSGYDLSKIVVSADTVDLDDTTIFMSGGTDGSMELGATISIEGTPTTITQAMIEETKVGLLESFFKCDVDVSVLDARIIDCSAIPDANYPTTIKEVILSEFPKYRPDVFYFADCGINDNEASAYSTALDVVNAASPSLGYMASVHMHSGVTTDLASPTKTTCMYEIVSSLSKLYSNRMFQLYASYDTGQITHMKYSWLAKKTKTDTIGKYISKHMNYAQQITRDGIVAFMSEDTMSAGDYTKLRSIRNALVVGDAQRLAQKILVKYTYTDKVASESMKAAMSDLTLNTVTNRRYPDSIRVEFNIYRTKRDIDTDNAHCDIIFYFPGITRSWTVTVIAKREEDYVAAV